MIDEASRSLWARRLLGIVTLVGMAGAVVVWRGLAPMPAGKTAVSTHASHDAAPSALIHHASGAARNESALAPVIANGAASIAPGPARPEPPSGGEPSAQDYIDRARQEPRDEAWATPTERLFEQDLRLKADRLGFRVGLVECHTDSCVAELFWESLRAARQDFKQALGAPDRTGCRPRLLLTEAGNEDAPEMGTMVLHCLTQRQRAARQAGLVVEEKDEEP